MSTEENRRDRAVFGNLNNTIRKAYPAHWKDIMNCIETNIGVDLDKIVERISDCIRNLNIPPDKMSDAQREAIAIAVRSHIFVG